MAKKYVHKFVCDVVNCETADEVEVGFQQPKLPFMWILLSTSREGEERYICPNHLQALGQAVHFKKPDKDVA